MTEAFLKEKLLKLYHQLSYGAEESIHGEPQAYLYLPNGKYIEVTYKEKEIPCGCTYPASCGRSNSMLKRYAKERAACLFWNAKRFGKVHCNFFESLPEPDGRLSKSCRSITDFTSIL